MQRPTPDIHVWTADLRLNEDELALKENLLSPDELKRARRFHFPIHQARFIAARGFLRELLSLYLNQAPESFRFTYAEHQKPSLTNAIGLTFNLAHSEDYALFAFSINQAIGIDLEKIEANKYSVPLAERYFSTTENESLTSLPEAERIAAFFHLWSRKEAIIKAVGKGLALPLASFSVSPHAKSEQIELEHKTWSLVQLDAPAGFAAALASDAPIQTISYWRFADHQPQKCATWTLTS